MTGPPQIREDWTLMAKKNKKPSALAAAASKRLARIGAPDPGEVAHAMFHAEQNGEVERVPLEDGSWAWAVPDPQGGPTRLMKPTPEMLVMLAQFEREGHPHQH